MDTPLFEEEEPQDSCFMVSVQSYSSVCVFIYIYQLLKGGHAYI